MDISRYKPKQNGQISQAQSVDGFAGGRSAPPDRGEVRRVVRRPIDAGSVTRGRMIQPPAERLTTATPVKRVIRRQQTPWVPTDMVYPRYIEPKRPLRPVKRRRGLFNSWGFRLAGSLLLSILIVGGFLSWRTYDNVHKVFRGTETVAALASDKVDPDMLDGEGDGRVNILLLGIGGEGHSGSDLTDTMLVMSVDPVNNTATMLSVPRDLWVKQPTNYFGTYQKINAAYESGKYSYLGRQDPTNNNEAAIRAGFQATDKVLHDVLGIKINYHVLVNFTAFKQAIDTVGGITIDVKEQLFDPTMAWENGKNPVLAPAGVQEMDGKKALLYARSRETSSDFARSQRQRQVILALKDKVLSAGTLSNPAKIDGLLQAFGNNLYSDLSTKGAQRLYTIFKRIDNGKVESVGLADAPNNFVTTDRVGNLSVVRPRAGFFNYSEIQAFVRGKLKDGFIVKENAPITVYSGQAAGSGTDTVVDSLKSYGYNVTDVISSTLDTGYQKTTVVDLSGGQAPYTLRYLEGRYHNVVTALPHGINIKPGSAKFVIILVQNETVNN